MSKASGKSSSSSSPSRAASAAAEISKAGSGEVSVRTEWQIHSGPLPDPRTLEYYNRVHPGASGEIFAMAKVEQKHRHAVSLRDWIALMSGTIIAGAILL